MPDVLTLKTAHFELTVWTKDIDKSQDLLIKTHITRGALLPTGTLRFNPALIIENVTPTTPLPTVVKPITELVLPNALFLKINNTNLIFCFSRG